MTATMTGCKHKHETGDWVVTVQPTCMTEGAHVKYCNDCSELVETEVMEKLPHNLPADWAVTKEATCTEEGEKVKVCGSCNEVIEREIIAKLSHEIVGGWKVTQESTCSASGRKEKFCSCALSMDEDLIPIDPYHHVNLKWAITTPATCSTTGLQDQYCLDCGQTLRTGVEVPKDANLHVYDVATNRCTICAQKELTEITSLNQAEWQDSKILIMLDYILAYSSNVLTLDANTEYVRLVGTPGREYALRIVVSGRSTPIAIDFVNTIICGGGAPTLSVESKVAVNIGFYGERCEIRGGNGTHGTDYAIWPSGTGGYCAISAPGDIHITIAAATCVVRGGSGGNGGKGSYGNDGGNGGNGAYGIYTESSIKATCKEGYSRSNFSLSGGSGGIGGAKGTWFFYSPQDGANGVSPGGSNVDVYYY